MMFFDDRKFLCKGILLIIVIGIAVRLISGTLLTYNYDVYHWTLTISNYEAGNGLYQTAGYYYTPVWGYILATFAQFYEFLGLDMIGDRFVDLLFVEDDICYSPHTAFVPSIPFSAAVTVMLCIVDLVSAYLAYWLVKEVFHDTVKAKICFSVYFLYSFLIVVSAIGGMFDPISVLMLLLCVCLLIKGQEFTAGMMLSAVALLKLFPAFLIFLFVAYVIARHREDWKPRILKAMLGAGLAAAVLMLPQVMDGTVADSFSFVLARAESKTSLLDTIVSSTSIIGYLAIILANIVLAYHFMKRRHDDIDASFVIYSFVGLLILFLMPGAPQYLLPMIPFLIIMAYCVESRFKVPMLLLMVFASIYMLSPLAMDFASLAVYTDLLPMDSFKAIYGLFDFQVYELNGFDVWNRIGLVLQTIGVLLVAAVTLIWVRDRVKGTDSQ